MTSFLEVRSLAKSYGGHRVVDGLSFSLERGEIFGLLGPNGAGKSTTMMMICGLLPADAGEVWLNGRVLSSKDPAARLTLGVVPQELAIYPDLTAAQNLRFFGRLYRLTGRELEARVEDALQRVGLTARANDAANTFSGGMKRRLNFAAAILHQPKLLILDEPTVGVDPQSRAHLLDCVRDLQALGTTVIYASHYMEEVEVLCGRAAIIDHGRLLACDTIPHLLSRIPQEVELQLSSPLRDTEVALPADCTVRTTETESLIRVCRPEEQTPGGLQDSVTDILNRLSAASIPVTSIRTLEPNLERLFLKLTGHRLRD